MNLSVESRVKAHISTPYIDADGRGTEGAYAADYADCMKSPAEFQEILRGGGKDDALLAQLEAHCAALVERSKVFHVTMEQREAARKKAFAAAAAECSGSVQSVREEQIERDRGLDSAKLDAAYHKRLESELDMDRYLRLLAKSDEAKVRDREERVTDRHAKLKARAQAATASQQAAVAEEKRRSQHLEGLKERILLELAHQAHEREREEIEARRQQEWAELQKQRQRECECNIAKSLIRAAQEADSLNWARARDKAIADAQHAAAVLAEKKRTEAQLVIAKQQELEGAAYSSIKHLQRELELHAVELQGSVKQHYGVGSHLERLMQAARATAEVSKTTFHGLALLRDATLKPSALTPDTSPSFTGQATRTIGTLTNVSEPIRPTSKSAGKGR